MSTRRLVKGKTSEGFDYELMFTYKTAALEDDLPERITRAYGASDGPGQVSIERADDGLFYAEGQPRKGHKHAAAQLPWVITEGQEISIIDPEKPPR